MLEAGPHTVIDGKILPSSAMIVLRKPVDEKEQNGKTKKEKAGA